MTSPALSPEQEAQAQELATAFRAAAADELLDIARLLVTREERQLFGDTEFQIRDLLRRIGAHAYTAWLREKKTATRAPVSSAPPADIPPNTIAHARKSR